MLRLEVGELTHVPGPDDRVSDLGTLYPEPFTSTLGMYAVSARVLGALANAVWDAGEAVELVIVLTPALADGESRVVNDYPHYRRVCVGLSPARWAAASIEEQRRILLGIALAQLRTATWALDLAALERAERELVAAYATLRAPVGDSTRVAIDHDLAHALEIERWSASSPDRRLAIGRAVVERLRASGRDLSDPTIGSDGIVRATAGDAVLVLVPGGRMRRGFDAEQLARLDRIHEHLWMPVAGGPARFPRELTPFGADVPCRVDREDIAEPAPFWMAERPLRIEPSLMPWETRDADAPPYATWPETLAALTERRMTLPSTDELLWAASAGDSRLFPWGDDARPIAELLQHDAHAIARMYGADPAPLPPGGNPFEVFASGNPFGLVAPLSEATWCLPEPGGSAPLLHAGGALGFYPWQGGWEAMLFLTRVVSSAAFDGPVRPSRAVIRPVIRISTGPC